MPGAHVLNWTDTLTGCWADSAFVVTDLETLASDWQVIQPFCFGDSGQVLLQSVTGGTPEYVLEGELGLLPPGQYDYVVTDAHACFLDTSFFLVEPLLLEVEVAVTNHPDATADVELLISGGTPPFVVLWDDGALGPARYGLPPGLYAWLAEDARGCKVFGAELLTPNGVSVHPSESWPPVPERHVDRWCFEGLGYCELALFDGLGRTLRAWSPLEAGRYCVEAPTAPTLWVVRDLKSGRIARFWSVP